MKDSIELIGVEQVQKAGNTMAAAAERMAQAAATVEASNHRFICRFEELIARMEVAAEKIGEQDERSMFDVVFGKH